MRLKQMAIMIGRGFQLGLLLQVAIGPVSVLIFQLANQGGFFQAFSGVLAVTLVDALFILAAILGLAAFLENKQVKKAFELLGSVIIVVFGVNTILTGFGRGFLPSLSLDGCALYTGPFIQGLIITAANPMTILFWAGVFAAKVAEENWDRQATYLFGAGAVFSTFLCQTFIAAIGSFLNHFLARNIIDLFNIVVGLILIYFAVRLMRNRKHREVG